MKSDLHIWNPNIGEIAVFSVVNYSISNTVVLEIP